MATHFSGLLKTPSSSGTASNFQPLMAYFFLSFRKIWNNCWNGQGDALSAISGMQSNIVCTSVSYGRVYYTIKLKLDVQQLWHTNAVFSSQIKVTNPWVFHNFSTTDYSPPYPWKQGSYSMKQDLFWSELSLCPVIIHSRHHPYWLCLWFDIQSSLHTSRSVEWWLGFWTFKHYFQIQGNNCGRFLC